MPERSYHRYSTSFPAGLKRPSDRVEFGPDLPESLDRRLLSDLSGKRVLELGCGMGHSAIAMTRMGAKVIGVEPDAKQIEHARDLQLNEEVNFEIRNSDLVDLAGFRENSFDAVISVFALASISDQDRVFRQVHRILRPEGPFVVSLPHPASAMVDLLSETPDVLVQSYFAPEPLGSGPSLTYPRSIADVFTGLVRANFRVDTIVEPQPTGTSKVPTTVVLRGKKVGT